MGIKNKEMKLKSYEKLKIVVVQLLLVVVAAILSKK